MVDWRREFGAPEDDDEDPEDHALDDNERDPYSIFNNQPQQYGGQQQGGFQYQPPSQHGEFGNSFQPQDGQPQQGGYGYQQSQQGFGSQQLPSQNPERVHGGFGNNNTQNQGPWSI